MMEETKILIADPNPEFRREVEKSLLGACAVRSCGDGVQTIELIRSFLPDILVLDLMMPGMDGITLLQRCAQLGLTPVVLATTRYVSEYVLDTAQKLGVGYVMVKPCSVDAVLCRIADMTERLHPASFASPEPRNQVSSTLLQLGFSTKHRGYSYLREAVLLMAKDPNQALTKELYPAVAEQCGVNAGQVERSIRSAITSAWGKCSEQIWKLYFPEGKTQDPCRPTNAAVISRLADGLKLASGE